MEIDIYEQYERDAEAFLAVHGLRVPAARLAEVREVLVRETRHEADTYAGAGGGVPGNTSLMAVCAAQLWCAGAVEDALLIHRARRTSMDATGAVDRRLMLGAGVDRTKAFLTALSTDEAREIVEEIVEIEEFYDADEFAAEVEGWYRPD